MVKVYRPDGVEEEKDIVDARECIAHCGYSYEPPVLAIEASEDEPEAGGASVAKSKKSAG